MVQPFVFPEEKIQSLSVCNVKITVFWDCEGGVLVDVMPTRKTIIFNTYIRTLTELTKCFKRVWIHNNRTEILLQHHCARLHTSTKPWRAIKKTLLDSGKHIYPTAIHLQPCRMRSVVWSLTMWVVQWEHGYMSRTWQCTHMAYIHLFLIHERPWEVDRDLAEKWGIDSNHHSSYWFSLFGNKYLPRKKMSGITFWTYLTYFSS